MKPLTIETTQRGSGGPGADAFNTYKALFPESPSDADVAAAQEAHGFHPAGYGAPMRIQIREQGIYWQVTWQSFASCD